METVTELLKQLSNNLLWGPPMLVVLAATGIYLMVGLRGLPLRKLGYGIRQLFTVGRNSEDGTLKGNISGFNALMTSLSATIGTGNITGVATAIATGGPGALFWMWCIALIGMATKYAEAVCAVHFRETTDTGEYRGGPMYYIKNGMGPRWHWLATAFAVFGMLAGFGIGNTVQANSVASALEPFVSTSITGVVLAILAGLVLLGGLRRIADVAGVLVPVMALLYVLCGLIVLALNADKIPAALELIVHHAFNPVAATGGFAGATVWAALRYGVARGIFSNEAGLGSAPIAHAAAKTDQPVRQGTIAMLGTFIDTLVVCSITGLVIIISGMWTEGISGAPLSSAAFNSALPGVGQYIVSLGQALFAFTTILGWSYYSERCTAFLFGENSVQKFRIVWVLVIPIGALLSLDFVWLLADILNALMALPNLIALLVLSPVVFKLSRDYFANRNGPNK